MFSFGQTATGSPYEGSKIGPFLSEVTFQTYDIQYKNTSLSSKDDNPEIEAILIISPPSIEIHSKNWGKCIRHISLNDIIKIEFIKIKDIEKSNFIIQAKGENSPIEFLIDLKNSDQILGIKFDIPFKQSSDSKPEEAKKRHEALKQYEKTKFTIATKFPDVEKITGVLKLNGTLKLNALLVANREFSKDEGDFIQSFIMQGQNLKIPFAYEGKLTPIQARNTYNAEKLEMNLEFNGTMRLEGALKLDSDLRIKIEKSNEGLKYIVTHQTIDQAPELNLNSKYVLPEEKKKIFYDVQMDGLDFSRIMTKY